MKQLIFKLSFTILVAAPLGCSRFQSQRSLASSDGEMVRMAGHAPNAISTSAKVGRVPQEQMVTLTIPLQMRNSSELASLVRRLHTPGDPQYGKYLSPAQFAEKFAPDTQALNSVIDYFQSNGFTVISSTPTSVTVQAPATNVEQALQIQMNSYQTPDGRSFFAPNNEPLMPSRIAALIHGIIGLDNAAKIKRHIVSTNASAGTTPLTSFSLTPNGLRKAYNLTSIPRDGSGQSVALLELDGYDVNDITAYAKAFNLGQPNIRNLLLDGVTGAPSSGAGSLSFEVTIDIEMILAVAPAANILVYEGPKTLQGMLDIWARIAHDGIAKQVSSSFFTFEDQDSPAFLLAENQIFMQLAAQGQSVYVASGDYGAYANQGTSPAVEDPASQPWVTSVGGTTLRLNADGSYNGESSWGDNSNGAGGGGGISKFWRIPNYQVGLANAYNHGSNVRRMIPDVSLNSNPSTGYAVVFQGQGLLGVGGTSLAAPIWAAFTALVNEGRAETFRGPIGFANYAIYMDARYFNYAHDFYDIADGSTNLLYPAVRGYDLSTGWGSMNGSSLYNTLLNY